MKTKTTFKRLKTENAIDIPLEEVDPKVSEETYCVISESWGQTFINRYEKSPSLCLFYPYSLIRRASVSFTNHIGYDIGLLLIILINLVDLAVPGTLPEVFERITILFYMSEVIHQSVSRGFISGSYSYLKDPFMCFDFVITMLSMYNIDLSRKDRLAGLQIFRGLRIFAIINKNPGVRLMGKGLILSITQMMSVTTIIFIFLVSVAIIAKHVFRGIFYQKCVLKLPDNFPQLGVSYFNFTQNEAHWLIGEHKEPVICGNLTGARTCNRNYTCLPDIGSTPFHNISNFDTFGLSMLNSLRLISTDTWEMLADDVNSAIGPICGFFFVPVVLVGTFYLRNLMLIVVVTAFESVMEAKKGKKELLSDYSYYNAFPFDIKRLALYPLETTQQTLKQVFIERDHLIGDKIARCENWRKMKDISAMQQIVVQKIQDQDHKHFKAEIEKAENEKFNILKLFGNCWKTFHGFFKKIAASVIFEKIILFVIILNAIFLASYHAHMSSFFHEILDIGNLVFAGIFTLEFIILFIALGIRYFYNWFRIVDFSVLLVTYISLLQDNFDTYSAFWAFRLVSLMRFRKSWKTFQKIIDITMNSIFNILRLVIMMTSVIFIFGVMTNHFLGPFYKKADQPPRWSFSTFGGSIFIVLNVFTGEWIDFLFTCMELSEKSPLCPSIFITMYIVGNLIVVSLFTALLLSSFEENIEFDNESTGISYYEKFKQFILRPSSRKETKEYDDTAIFWSCLHSVKKTRVFIKLKQFALSNTFEGIIIFLVVYSCIIMIIDDTSNNPYDDPIRYQVTKMCSILCAVLFTLEMIIRWIGIGIRNYFSDPWLILDFILVIVIIVEVILVYNYKASHSVTYLRILRSLRPLRFIRKVKRMETIVGAFILSLPVILRYVIVCLFIWLPFGILGIHFYAGTFSQCVDSEGHAVNVTKVANKTSCLEKKYVWENNFQNFDHIGNGYMVLFQMALFGNWADLAQLMVDYSAKDHAPVINAHAEHHIFVIFFLLVGGFFSLNLFIGVAVDTFQTMHNRVKGGPTELALTNSQKAYYRAMRKIGRRKLFLIIEPPSNPILKACYKITNSWWFRIIVFILICANATTVAVSSYKESHGTSKTLRIIEYSFVPAFCLEFLIKILGLRKHYFEDIFNIQDLCTLIAYFIGEAIEYIFQTRTNLLAFLFAFRIIRIIQLLHLSDIFISLRLLMYATVASIPPLLNLSLLLLVIHFIYALIGVALFGHVKYDVYINTHTNFENVHNAMLVLFRLTTSEGWEKVYEGLSIAPPHCEPNVVMVDTIMSNCGSRIEASIYLVSFIFLTHIILVNIFIAVILDNYKEAIAEEQDIFKEKNLMSFNKIWNKYDPTGTQFVPVEKLSNLLDELVRDLRIPKPNSFAICYMNVPLTIANKVHSLDVLQGILKVKAGKVEETETFRALRSQMQLRYQQMFPELKGSRFVGTTMDVKRREFAARKIQKYFKNLEEAKLTMMDKERKQMSRDLLAPSRRFTLAPSRRLSADMRSPFSSYTS